MKREAAYVVMVAIVAVAAIFLAAIFFGHDSSIRVNSSDGIELRQHSP